MSKPVHIHNARFGKFPVTCACGNQITLSLVKGSNKRSTVGALAVIVILAVVILGAVSWQRVHRIGSVSGTRMIDGELWHVVGQDGEWVKLERVSQYELAERSER